MTDEITIADLMLESGVKFGTSGARGLVVDMTDRICFAYTAGFLKMLMSRGELSMEDTVCVGGDRRPSTPRIMGAAAAAIGPAHAI